MGLFFSMCRAPMRSENLDIFLFGCSMYAARAKQHSNTFATRFCSAVQSRSALSQSRGRSILCWFSTADSNRVLKVQKPAGDRATLKRHWQCFCSFPLGFSTCSSFAFLIVDDLIRGVTVQKKKKKEKKKKR